MKTDGVYQVPVNCIEGSSINWPGHIGKIACTIPTSRYVSVRNVNVCFSETYTAVFVAIVYMTLAIHAFQQHNKKIPI